MAFDDFEQEWHLTTAGWTKGEDRSFGDSKVRILTRPSNAIETWLYKIYPLSQCSKERTTWDCVWINPDIDFAARERIKQTYPEPIVESSFR